MNDKRIETKRKDRPLVAIFVESPGAIGEKAVTAHFGLLREVRSEISQRTLGVIDWVDGAQQGGARLLRSVNQRVDDIVNALIDSGERVGLAAVRTVSPPGGGVGEPAAQGTDRASRASISRGHESWLLHFGFRRISPFDSARTARSLAA